MAIEEQVVRRETVLEVDRGTAWDALRDPRELEGWLADEVELEIVEGAEGVLRWRDGEERAARVEEVAEGRRLALHWWEPGGEPTLVELTLDDVPEGTRLVVIEVPVVQLRIATSAIRTGPAAGPRMAAAAA